ncbi:MAG: DUF5683 domain-containing protein [Chitinophagales bacterium]|nr:DUF5683 domain-containing protein [Chitinophagales bacterium]MCZ2393359.1 DUF5683 domain-containing protein [Chitinophagales bacterium]
MNSKHIFSTWLLVMLYIMFYAMPLLASDTSNLSKDSLKTDKNWIEEKDKVFIDTLSSDLTSIKDSSILIQNINNKDIILENNKGDNKKKPREKEDIPIESIHARKAAKWSILPGGGQIYNKRWWKVPIAWGMIGAGGYWIFHNASNMQTYNRALDLRNSGQIDEFSNILNEQQLIAYRNHYRRNLQLSTFGTIGLWSLTLLDAVVDAHLKTYDISDNLSIKFKPKVLRVYNNSVPSIAITLYL